MIKNMRGLIFWLLGISIVGVIGGYLVLHSALPDYYYDSIRFGKALFWFSSAFGISSVFLIIFPQAFNAWRKFAIWFVPLVVLLFIFYPEPGAMDFLSPHPETVYEWVSGLYVVVSAALILVAVRKKT